MGLAGHPVAHLALRDVFSHRHDLAVGGLQVLADLDEQGPDPLQPLQQFARAIRRIARRLAAHRPLGPFERHAALLDQVVDPLQVLDVLRREEPVALLVPLRPQHAELRLPMTDERLIDVEHFGDLAHRVIEFFSHICQSCFMIRNELGYKLFTRRPIRLAKPSARPRAAMRFIPSANSPGGMSCRRR